MKYFIILALLLGVNLPADALSKKVPLAKASRPVAPKKLENKVLDFKDQVIESDNLGIKTEVTGQRKVSPVFDLGKNDSSLDSIVFKRSNFNDFHDLQMKQHVLVQAKGEK